MAIITPSELFSSIRGSIGSTTFSQSRAGLIAKRKLLGRKNYTTKQADVIKIQSFIVGQWMNLSTEVQSLWNDYADLYAQIDRYGTEKLLSGFNWFVHMNNLKYAFDSTLINEPPARISAEIVDGFSVLNYFETLSIEFDSEINYENNLLYIFATLPNQLSRSTNRGKLRLIKVIDSPNLTSVDLTADYESEFNISWTGITANSNFKIQVCMYNVNKTSWMNSVQLCGIGQLQATPVFNLITEDEEDFETEGGEDLEQE